MLRLERVSFSYAQQEKLYNDLQFDFGVCGITALWGISGSGKTTLLKIIGWLIEPQEWNIIFEWISLSSFTRKQLTTYRNKHVWFSFQDHVLLDECSVQQNLMLPFLVGWWSVDREWYNYLVDIFSLRDLLDKSIESISWWEKERVSLVKSLIHKPYILLLDEPWDSLDAALKTILRNVIQDYAENHIVILASHDASLIKLLWLEQKATLWPLSLLCSN